MKNKIEPQLQKIGIINQIIDDTTLNFIVSSDIVCRISDLILINDGLIYVIAQISEIQTDYYIEKARQFFISKAVDNTLDDITDNPPRFAQIAKANILGQYYYSLNSFHEIKSSINRYTPKILQTVFRLSSIDSSLEIFGLTDMSKGSANCINLGCQIFPFVNHEKPLEVFFKLDTFFRHTLITGVTGSGKSRLASLIIHELTMKGFHISILDPHNEYSNILINDNYTVHKYIPSLESTDFKKDNLILHNLEFNTENIDTQTLTKLLPSLSSAQEALIYEILNENKSNVFSVNKLIDVLIKDLGIEIFNEPVKIREQTFKIKSDSEKRAKNNLEYVKFYMQGLRQLTDLNKNSRSGVIIAVISKLNELIENKLISTKPVNWLLNNPYTIDIFNIDYSSNEYIRRFINSIIQFFLRKNDKDAMRIFIIDEAHMLFNENKTTISLIKQLLREGRKYGISVMFISQNFNDIPEDIRSQFQNFFNFREVDSKTKYYTDQTCSVNLYGSKIKFAMKVKNFNP